MDVSEKDYEQIIDLLRKVGMIVTIRCSDTRERETARKALLMGRKLKRRKDKQNKLEYNDL